MRAWLPVAVWAAAIFALSSIPSLGTGLGTWDLVLRKLAHGAEYAVLGALLVRALARPLPSFVLGVLYAASDEVHQHFVSGRRGAPLDVAIDAAGVALGLLAWQRWGRAHVREQEQLDRLIGLVREVLGPDARGAYLHGSAALGDLRPRSDIDVLVVSSRSTTREEKRRLVQHLLAISGGRNRPIELTIVDESEIRPWRYPPAFDFQYGDWLREEFASGDVEPWPTRTNPDLAVLLTMVRLADRPLLGPPPAELVDPVPRADLVEAMTDGIDGLLASLGSDTRNVLLTLARIWCTVATGEIRPKDAAADWALERLPDEHRPVLARARDVYAGDEEEHWEDLQPRLRPHADHVVGEIRRLAAAYTPSR